MKADNAYKEPPRLTRCFSKDEITQAIEKRRILSLSVKLPVGCNLRCKYCYSSRDTQGLSYVEWIKILRDASALGVRSVSIIGAGEPLLYRDIHSGNGLIDFIREANTMGISIVLFTNNTCIDTKCAEELFTYDVTVVCKLNSNNDMIQDELIGVQGGSQKIKQGLKALIDAGFTRDRTRLSIHTVICKQNYAEIPEMWRQWRTENIIPYVQSFVPPRNINKQFIEELSVSSDDTRTLFRKLLEIDREFGFDWDPDYTYPIAGLGCSVVKTGCCIAHDGAVQMCGYLDESIGSLRETSLKDIFDSTYVRKIRSVLYPQSQQGSAHFYGCRATAFNMTGDRFSEDPLFWKSPKCGE